MKQENSLQAKGLDVALQGGGSHGAFTWGVLDYLLERPEINLEGICGTSAGAVNGAVLAYGLAVGGRQHARELLHELWEQVSLNSYFTFFKPSPYDYFFGGGNMDTSPSYYWLQFLMQFSSPYHYNPQDRNPLRDILTKLVDFEIIRKQPGLKLFVCATNVRRGRLRVFHRQELTLDAVLASSCLPYLFKAVTIDGEDYWDGGYMGNPPIFPLIDGTVVRDILIVQVNPINIKETPTEPNEILDRINEISFNSSLMLEMRRVHFVQRLLAQGIDLDGKLKDIYIHMINPEEVIAPLNISSKMNTEWTYLLRLKNLGRAYAAEWLTANFDALGERSTCDVREVYL